MLNSFIFFKSIKISCLQSDPADCCFINGAKTSVPTQRLFFGEEAGLIF